MRVLQRHNHTPLLRVIGQTLTHKKRDIHKHTFTHKIPLEPLRVIMAQFVLSSLITLIAADVQ